MPQERTTEEILRELIRSRGTEYLRKGNLFVNAVEDMGGTKGDVRLLRYLAEVDGANTLLDADGKPPAVRQTIYNQTVEKICDTAQISADRAHQACAIFWRAAYNEVPPATYKGPRKPAPSPEPAPKPEPAPPQPGPAPQSITQPVPLPSSQKPKYLPPSLKFKYYISKDFAQRGGKFSVYLKASKVDSTIPPNTHHRASAPYVSVLLAVDAEKCEFTSDLDNYSDELIEYYLSHHKSQFLFGIQYFFKILILLCAFDVLVSILAVLVTALTDIIIMPLLFKSGYSVASPLLLWLLWIWPVPLALYWTLCEISKEFRFREPLQREVERRKKLPLWKP